MNSKLILIRPGDIRPIERARLEDDGFIVAEVDDPSSVVIYDLEALIELKESYD